MKGILFKPEMIRAIIEKEKTVTRRVIKPQPKYLVGEKYSQWFWCRKDVSEIEAMQLQLSHAIWWDGVRTPRVMTAFARYRVGEPVYIKEVHYRYGEWRKNGLTKSGRQKWLFHPMPEMLTISIIKGIESLRYFDNPPDEVKPNSYRKEGWYKRSPLFMPEWAARHFITVTDVRAERLQEITEEDCLAEGITVMLGAWQSKKWNADTRRLELTGERHPYTGLYHFEVIWNTINKDYLWESNPWVFRYEFEYKEGK